MMELLEAPVPTTAPTTPNGFDEFLQTGRTGRRNAVPEVVPGEGDAQPSSSGAAATSVAAGPSVGALTGALDKLTCQDSEATTSEQQACSSSQDSFESPEGGATSAASSTDSEQCNTTTDPETT